MPNFLFHCPSHCHPVQFALLPAMTTNKDASLVGSLVDQTTLPLQNHNQKGENLHFVVGTDTFETPINLRSR